MAYSGVDLSEMSTKEYDDSKNPSKDSKIWYDIMPDWAYSSLSETFVAAVSGHCRVIFDGVVYEEVVDRQQAYWV